MKWITREKAKVDRIACPWLIKNFIDKEAEFIFVLPDQVLTEAEKENAISLTLLVQNLIIPAMGNVHLKF